MKREVQLVSVLLIFIISSANASGENDSIKKTIFENQEVYRVVTLLEPSNLLKNYVYIEEFAENSEEENSTCSEDLKKLQEALYFNVTLFDNSTQEEYNSTQEIPWTYKMLDASTKIPSGLLEGNIVDLGMYDECLDIRGDSEIRGQHCMYGLKLQSISGFVDTETKLSICVPSSCSVNDVLQFLNTTIDSILDQYDVHLNLSEVSVTCSPLDQEIWDTEFIVCFAILVIFIAFLVTCTVCEILLDRCVAFRGNKTMIALMQFSFKKNANAIFNMNLSKGNLPVLHGLRFISMAWIVLGHEFMYMSQFPLINKFRLIDQWLLEWNSLHVFTAQFAVDTFFAISGFLLAYIVLKQKQFNLPLYYLHRIIRLTPAIIALFFIFVVFVPKLGSGPLWHSTIYRSAESCREKWWPTFLYVQNFVHQDECLGHLWYLAVDMQLFWISPIILYPLQKKWKIGLFILTSLFLASVITPAVIIVVNEYPVASYLKLTEMTKFKEMFNNVYIPPYTRSAPWFVGVFFGYEVVIKNRKPSKHVIYIGWLLALGGFAFCTFFTRYFLQTDYTFNAPLEAIYTSISRPIWGFGVCWIIYASVHNCGGVIVKFLSSRIFLPFSRLSYCIYLLHMIVEITQASALRTVRYFSDYSVWYHCLPDITISIVAAIIFSLLFESPVVALEKKIFKRPKKTITESQKELTISTIKNHKEC